MRVLIANDDGFDAEGIRVLVKQLSQKHEVYVSAPNRQRSASSHCVTYFLNDLRASSVEIDGAKKAWKVSGTPADCVYAGIYGLMDEKPDVVISGINDGPNFSTDSIYSGTVGAAEEGMILGIPSIAVSLHGTKNGFEGAAKITEQLLNLYMNVKEKHLFTLSVNVPDLPLEQMKGLRVCHFDGMRQYGRRLKQTIEEDGVIRLSLTANDIPLLRNDEDDRGDVGALESGYITLSALDVDIVEVSCNAKLLSLEEDWNRSLEFSEI